MDLRSTSPKLQHHGLPAGISCTHDSHDFSDPYTVTSYPMGDFKGPRPTNRAIPCSRPVPYTVQDLYQELSEPQQRLPRFYICSIPEL